MTILDDLERAEKAAKCPNHGEDTWEQKQAWDRANEADTELETLLRNHAADLIATARAAREYRETLGPKEAVALDYALAPLLAEQP